MKHYYQSLAKAWLLSLLVLLLGCAAKRDGFVGAREYPYPQLPPSAVQLSPAYPVPEVLAAESDVRFISRPRPLPGFIGGLTVPDYAEEQLRSFTPPRQPQSYLLGYNSRQEPSLFINEYLWEFDAAQTAQVLAAAGLRRLDPSVAAERGDVHGIEAYALGATEVPLLNLYHYSDALMISWLAATEAAPNEGFGFLAELREMFLGETN